MKSALAWSCVLVLASSLSIGGATPAFPQGTARSMDIDVSIRSAAMGGASNAVFWNGDLNHWANPALTAYTRGIRYERGRTQLVPGLADDVFITSNVVKIGGGGIGFVSSGIPIKALGVDLDYGTSEGVDEQGNPTGRFASYERVDSWGFGLNLIQLADAALAFGGSDVGRLSRYIDVSFGMNFKDVEVALAPSSQLGRGSTSAQDLGGLVRFTPLNFLGTSALLPIRVDIAYGASDLSYNDDAKITFENQPYPVSRHRRHGVAGRVAMDLPGWNAIPKPGLPFSWLLEGASPLIAIGASQDRAKISAGRNGPFYETSGDGIEVTLANIFSLRRGHYEDLVGDIDGTTDGWGIAIPIGKFAGAQYDEAHFPQARNSDLEDLHRKSFSVWVDPFAVWHAMGRSRSPRDI